MRTCMHIFGLIAFAMALAAFPFSNVVMACGPGPGKGPQAQLGPSKAKGIFDKPDQSTVHLELLDRALKNVAKKCGEQDLEINSGYRSPAYNEQVNGAKNSQHKCGNAADFKYCKGKSIQEMCRILAEAGCGGIGGYPTFVQCDIGPVRSWGSCPKNRPPPDEPIPERGNKDQPPTAYDSKTPPEPGQQNAGAPDSSGNDQDPPQQQAGNPPPSQGQSYSQGGQAYYPSQMAPQNRNYRAQNEAGRPNGSVKIDRPKQDDLIKGESENNYSTITRQGDPVAPDRNQNNGERIGPNRNSSPTGWSPQTGKGLPASAGGGEAGNHQIGPYATKGSGAAAQGSPSYGGNGGNGWSGGGAKRSGVGGASSSGGTNEVLSNFSGKQSLGGSKLSSAGSDMDAAVKNIQEEFGHAVARKPASEEVEDDSLFSRCHMAHRRCVEKGCVSPMAGATK